MKTTIHPPAFPGSSEPEVIIGVNLLADFKAHYLLVRFVDSPESFEKVVKSAGISEERRYDISEAYSRLRAAGWYIDGLDKHKRVKWRYQLDLRLPEIATLGRIDAEGNNLDGVVYSREECASYRAKVHKRMGRVGKTVGMPKCKPWDYEPADSGR